MSQDLDIERTVTRAQVQALECEMRKFPQLELETIHHFFPGIYMRELRIPAGTILTGKIHKTQCWSILAKGKMMVSIENQMREIEAPYMHEASIGIKRVAYALEDSVWITMHFTEERDVSKLEEQLVCETEEEYQMFLKQESVECLS